MQKRTHTKKPRRVVVFGVFDLLHPGHVAFLTKAKRFGDELVVVLTRDARVIAEKKHKPFHSEQDRKTVLTALRHVDRVVLGDRGKQWTMIKRLSPHVIVLGPDQSAAHPAIQQQLRSISPQPVIRTFGKAKHHGHASSKIRSLPKQRLQKGRRVP